MLKEENIINIMKKFITAHMLNFNRLDHSDYMGEAMLHVQEDSFVDGQKGFSILSRYTKTCRENADNSTFMFYINRHPSKCPGTLFRKPNGSFRPLLVCLHLHCEKEPSDQCKSEMTITLAQK